MEINEDIVIVGAGIAGLTTSLGLHRLGLRSLVLESSDSLRVSGFGLIISTNAWRALDAVGIGDYLRRQHFPINELQGVSLSTGLPMFKTPLNMKGKHGNYNEVRCVKRKLLLETLAKELPQGSVRYSSKIVFIEELGPFKLVHLADGSLVKAKALIGCDGVNSVVAKWLGFDKPRIVGQAAVRGIVEFPDGHNLEPNQFLQYYGDGIRYGHVQCDEKTVYWFFTFWPYHEKDHKELKNNPERTKQFVLSKLIDKISPKSKSIIEKTELNNLALASLKMRWPWHILFGNICKGNVCVAGDALHPMTPDIGQGGCSALEDAVVLARCLGVAISGDGKVGLEEQEDESIRIEMGLAMYAKERRWRDTLIPSISCLLAYLQQSNGIVMRYVGKFLTRFLLKRQLKLLDFDCGKLVQPTSMGR